VDLIIIKSRDPIILGKTGYVWEETEDFYKVRLYCVDYSVSSFICQSLIEKDTFTNNVTHYAPLSPAVRILYGL